MSPDTDPEQLQEQQHSNRIEQQSHQAASSVAAEEARKRIKNPEFLQQLQEPDIDTELWDWVEDELGPVFSGAHILGNRDEHYDEHQHYLNSNKAERMIAERTPGRLLRQNPLLLAVAQGATGWKRKKGVEDHPAFRAPLSSRKRRVIRAAMEVATSRQSLSKDARGLDAVANATVENRTVTNEESDREVASKASEVFR